MYTVRVFNIYYYNNNLAIYLKSCIHYTVYNYHVIRYIDIYSDIVCIYNTKYVLFITNILYIIYVIVSIYV